MIADPSTGSRVSLDNELFLRAAGLGTPALVTPQSRILYVGSPLQGPYLLTKADDVEGLRDFIAMALTPSSSHNITHIGSGDIVVDEDFNLRIRGVRHPFHSCVVDSSKYEPNDIVSYRRSCIGCGHDLVLDIDQSFGLTLNSDSRIARVKLYEYFNSKLWNFIAPMKMFKFAGPYYLCAPGGAPLVGASVDNAFYKITSGIKTDASLSSNDLSSEVDRLHRRLDYLCGLIGPAFRVWNSIMRLGIMNDMLHIHYHPNTNLVEMDSETEETMDFPPIPILGENAGSAIFELLMYLLARYAVHRKAPARFVISSIVDSDRPPLFYPTKELRTVPDTNCRITC